jgi:plastocyanin
MGSLRRSFSPSALLAIALLICMVGALSPGRAAAVNTRVVATRGQFVPGETKNHVPAVAVKGGKLVFTNLDPFAFSAHTLTSDALACPTCAPLFDSGDVAYGKSFTLNTSKLKAGTYKFHCNHHNMRGTLRVVGV